MGIYHTTGVSPKVPVVPDGCLSLDVPRRKPGNKSRKSYVVWEEADIVPLWILEMVSWMPGGEYDNKLAIYQKLGVLYYVIYTPEYWRRDRHQPFELYKLIDGQYELQLGEPYWMPEIGLAIGRSQGLGGALSEKFCLGLIGKGSDILQPKNKLSRPRNKLSDCQNDLGN